MQCPLRLFTLVAEGHELRLDNKFLKWLQIKHYVVIQCFMIVLYVN